MQAERQMEEKALSTLAFRGRCRQMQADEGRHAGADREW
jgi:hypothetical protein